MFISAFGFLTKKKKQKYISSNKKQLIKYHLKYGEEVATNIKQFGAEGG